MFFSKKECDLKKDDFGALLPVFGGRGGTREIVFSEAIGGKGEGDGIPLEIGELFDVILMLKVPMLEFWSILGENLLESASFGCCCTIGGSAFTRSFLAI